MATDLEGNLPIQKCGEGKWKPLYYVPTKGKARQFTDNILSENVESFDRLHSEGTWYIFKILAWVGWLVSVLKSQSIA